MKIDLSTDVTQQLNQEALEIVNLVTHEPKELNISNGVYRPNIPTWLVNLTNKEVPFASVRPVIDIDGKEMARFFLDENPSIGFANDSHSRFVNFCLKIQQLKNIEPRVSFTFIVETVFNWVQEKHINSTSRTLVEYLLTACNSEIINQEIWTPISGIKLDIELDLEEMLLKPITEINWRRWITEWNSRKPSELDSLKEFFETMGNKYPSVAVTKLIAEPIRAIELSTEKVESFLSILRYFSPANFNPTMHTYCAIYGKEYIERPKHIFIKNELITLASVTDSNLRWKHPWLINQSLVNNMKERGFDVLINLNRQEEHDRTEFQNALLKSLKIYSKSSLAQNLSDKLLYIVVSLENLLLKDNSEPLQKNISDRMALLIGRSLDERLDIIKNYKKAYKLRSDAVHHGADLNETPYLKRFMHYSWWTFNKLIEQSDYYLTKEEMINSIDDIKFK